MFFNISLVLLLTQQLTCNPKVLWPAPALHKSGNASIILSRNFQFTTVSKNKRLLQALYRFQTTLNSERWVNVVPIYSGKLDEVQLISGNHLKRLVVVIEQDESLDLDDTTDESYNLDVSTDSKLEAHISAKTVYGAMYGLESFVQMVQYDMKTERNFISNIPISISDAPLFKHRGLLLDTSRNYFPVSDIKRTIVGMAYVKMNVFHWHIVDSHSWPFQSQSHPLLWQKGTIFPNQIYSYQDIREVVAYGLDRGVRVIPEIEAPGHAYAIGLAYPELGVCMDFDNNREVSSGPPSGQLDPTNPKSLKLVTDLMDEFNLVFKDKLVHLGGDEVNLGCWNTSEKIREYVESNKISLNKLFEDFATNMHTKNKLNRKVTVVWQEILLNHNIVLDKSALIQVWISSQDVRKVINKGYQVIVSPSNYWYLDCGRGTPEGNNIKNSWCDPYKHWQLIYSYDPFDGLDKNQRKFVVGGEVAAWSEIIDPINLDPLIWPRTAAAAEVLWSGNRDIHDKLISTKYVLPRLNNFRFRLVGRGFAAEPLQPLWCVVNPYRCDAN